MKLILNNTYVNSGVVDQIHLVADKHDRFALIQSSAFANKWQPMRCDSVQRVIIVHCIHNAYDMRLGNLFLKCFI